MFVDADLSVQNLACFLGGEGEAFNSISLMLGYSDLFWYKIWLVFEMMKI
jgi:hypothetical protein